MGIKLTEELASAIRRGGGMKMLIKRAFNAMGYDITPLIPLDMEKQFLEIYQVCKEYTVTSIERMYALYKATQYIIENRIPGDIVECGVWKGGSMMLCALTLQALKDTRKSIYLYDTYSGMAEPMSKDVNYKGETEDVEEINTWSSISLGTVKKVMFSTEYPPQNLYFIQGKVEDTIPGIVPEKISILRLDTDFYESTYHEMVHMFPRLSPNGVLIIDDYGHWKGAREVVDKYINDNNIRILLNRIDYTGRLGIRSK